MATTHSIYDNALLGLADGSIRWGEDTHIAAVLLTGDYSPDLETHSTYADLKDHEAEDSDYDPVAVEGRDVTLTEDGDDNSVVDYTSDDVVFASQGSMSGRYVAFVQGDPDNLSDSDKLISVHDFGEEVSSTNSEFRLNMQGYWFRLQRA